MNGPHFTLPSSNKPDEYIVVLGPTGSRAFPKEQKQEAEDFCRWLNLSFAHGVIWGTQMAAMDHGK